MDREFECLQDTLNCKINTIEADGHVPEIERSNRVIKERFWAAQNREKHFTKLPNLVIIEIARQNIFRVNAFPIKRSVSENISPRVLLTVTPIDYKNTVAAHY